MSSFAAWRPASAAFLPDAPSASSWSSRESPRLTKALTSLVSYTVWASAARLGVDRLVGQQRGDPEQAGEHGRTAREPVEVDGPGPRRRSRGAPCARGG